MSVWMLRSGNKTFNVDPAPVMRSNALLTGALSKLNHTTSVGLGNVWKYHV
jgi:hypothetical protein